MPVRRQASRRRCSSLTLTKQAKVGHGQHGTLRAAGLGGGNFGVLLAAAFLQDQGTVRGLEIVADTEDEFRPRREGKRGTGSRDMIGNDRIGAGCRGRDGFVVDPAARAFEQIGCPGGVAVVRQQFGPPGGTAKALICAPASALFSETILDMRRARVAPRR